jgi:hypothetical protein
VLNYINNGLENQNKTWRIKMNKLKEILKKQLNKESKIKASVELGITHDELLGLLDDEYFGYIRQTNNIDPRTFFKVLCSYTSMNKNKQVNMIEQYIQLLNDEKNRYPYIYVDTGFVRDSQPIFVMAMMESQRRFKPDENNDIGKIVKEHYTANNGTLEFWGDIKRYAYHDKKNKITVYDGNGNIMESNEVKESIATIRIK